MKILLTGSSSGVGQELLHLLANDHAVDAPLRQDLDLSNSDSVLKFADQITEPYDMLINCAGTGIGGKIDFVNHQRDNIKDILQVNFVSVVLLTQHILKVNPECKIVNITSTNNNRYWPNDLAYSLSKKSLELFGSMLTVEYPTVKLLEVRLGLTRTCFNDNRYINDRDRYQNIYSQHKHLDPTDVACRIKKVLFDETIKQIEISP